MMEEAEVIARLQRRVAEVGDAAMAATAPLYQRRGRAHVAFLASSVLLRAGDRHFLVTAGHVLDDLRGNQLFAGGESDLVELGKRGAEWRRSRGVDGLPASDKADLAVLLLAHDEVAALATMFLLPGNLAPAFIPDPTPVGGTYYVCVGFPASRQSTWLKDGALHPKQMYLTLRPGPPLKEMSAKYEERVNISVEFDKREGVGRNGEAVLLPDPVGMSGGGIWAVNGLVGLRPEPARLVAIATTWCPRAKAIVGTKLGVALDAMAELVPELESELPWPEE